MNQLYRTGKPGLICSGRSCFTSEGLSATADSGCKNHSTPYPYMKMTLLILVMLVSGIGSWSTAQDTIFRRNGEKSEVYDLTRTGKSRSYRLKDDPQEVRRWISISSIDSIWYADGTKDAFNYPEIMPVIPETEEKQDFDRNYIVLDIGSLTFYKNLKFSYERLLGKGFVGLFATYAYNLDPLIPYIYEGYGYENEINFYDPMNRVMTWNFRAGANFYIFKPGYFRLAAGLSWITGDCSYIKNVVIDQDPWMTTDEQKNETVNGFLLSPALHYQPGSFYQFRLGLDIPITVSPNFDMSMITLEAAINF